VLRLVGAVSSGSRLWWEPTLSAMSACLNLARYRGIADKVGSHKVYSTLMATSLAVVGAASAAMGACLDLARYRGIAAEAAPTG